VDRVKSGDVWAIALSADGKYLASSSITGKVNVWSLDEEDIPKIREYETKGSFGMCVDLVLFPDLVRMLDISANLNIRAKTDASLPRGMKTDPSTSSTTTLDVWHTLSPASSIPSEASPSRQHPSSSLPLATLESLPSTM